MMEMCPGCGKISNMVSSTSTKTKTDSYSFHCERCRQFFRSEDREEAASYRKSAIPVGGSATPC
ncbi:MAG: hypothetical protein KKD47_10850 [Proteobacteria bacterium]|nr:hypothetical protein [Pseudomonadota bacterium]